MESLLDVYMHQKTHFGTSPIKNWIDSGDFKMHYPDFYDIELYEQK